MSKEAQVACRNVFKNENEKIFKEEFNKKWIELISQIEKSKSSKIQAQIQ